MSAVKSFAPSVLTLTPAAVAQLRRLAAEEGKEDLALRVYVTGGGCSGFQYGFALEEEVAEDDTVVEVDGVRALVDPLSLQYLRGATVDYEEGLQGARFVVRNPNAATTCGCGASFTI